MVKAYLVMKMKENDGPLPEFCGVEIHSSDPMGCVRFGYFHVVLMEIEDEDFEKARERIIRCVMDGNGPAWVKPWLTGGEGQQRLIEILGIKVKVVNMLSWLARTMFYRRDDKLNLRSDILLVRDMIDMVIGLVIRITTATMHREDERVHQENRVAETAAE